MGVYVSVCLGVCVLVFGGVGVYELMPVCMCVCVSANWLKLS